MSKYNRPEWVSTPISAQISEALKEVEQVRSALMALQSKAAQLNEYHQMRVEFTKQQMSQPSLSAADKQKLQNAVAKIGNFGVPDAGKDLERLDRWFKSLLESEMGLHALIKGDVSQLAAALETFVKDESMAWQTIRRPAFLFGSYGASGRRG